MPLPEAPCDAVAGRTIVETAYAKINLALHVRSRRPDGYHELDSLFAFAEHGDRLTGLPAGDGAISLTIDGPFAGQIDTGPGNLVVRAAHALANHLGKRVGAALHLSKQLPVSSGIGGGSADAAAALRLLVRLWDMEIEAATLREIALELGSDVPACLASVPQRVRGRGEVLLPEPLEGLDSLPLLLVNPGVAVSTGAIFAAWDGIDRGPLDAPDIARLVRHGRNDLEAPATALAPAIADILAALGECTDLVLARMSGSGATCFALFSSEAGRDAASAGIATAHPDWWTLASRIRAA
ncbi:MAG: 4-(cytidine 5'-diphospho)-2-C-methyl-D-erythritol kinase [Sphingobium sp.]